MSPRPLYTCKNLTRQTEIASRVKKADNYFLRLCGLLPKSHLESGEGLWIIPCGEIHSIGMRFVFDAIFLDKDLKVVHLIERMPPLRVSPMIREAKTVLEVEAGTIEKSLTAIQDQIIFEVTSK